MVKIVSIFGLTECNMVKTIVLAFLSAIWSKLSSFGLSECNRVKTLYSFWPF